MGVAMGPTRRLELIEWAAANRAWVLEDDYDSEYRYASRPLGSLQGLDSAGRVIFVGTFSKVFFPALRIGYLVVPPTMIDTFVAAREALDIYSPTLPQLALTDFIREGHFTRHLRRMRAVYASRRQALLDGLERHCAGLLTVHNADAGIHLTTLLPGDIDDVGVVRELSARQLAPAALSTCYAGRARRKGLLLGFGGADEQTLESATGVLGQVLLDSRASRTVSPAGDRAS
jgi:GntR family transcriptional regulator/MocR family aminotransferase